MPKLTKKLPSCRLHKPTGQAVVTLPKTAGANHRFNRFVRIARGNGSTLAPCAVASWSCYRTRLPT